MEEKYILKIGFLTWDLNECRFYFWVPNVKMRWSCDLDEIPVVLSPNLPASEIYPSFVPHLTPSLGPSNFLLSWWTLKTTSESQSTIDGLSNAIKFQSIESWVIEVREIQKWKKKGNKGVGGASKVESSTPTCSILQKQRQIQQNRTKKEHNFK